MSETTNLTIRIDKKLKKESEELFKDLGMTMTTAITTFLKQSIRSQGLPYPISKNVPNAETMAAINESLINSENREVFETFEDFKSSLMKEYSKQNSKNSKTK